MIIIIIIIIMNYGVIIKSISTLTYTVWHVDKYIITFKLVISHMWRVWGRIKVCTECWWGSLRERGYWGDQNVDGRIILRWIFMKLAEGIVGTGWSWLRIGTGGGHCWEK
jgi:hypothetical protein